MSATASFLAPGHEAWHPNPAFYYAPGGGPMFDMGPYYLTALVNVLGPVAAVSAMGCRAHSRRVVGSGPRAGQSIEVEVDTHVAATLRFADGPVVTMTTSFDVAAAQHNPLELYGTEGSLVVPNPNNFGGPVSVAKAGERDADRRPVWREAALVPGETEASRSIGLADMCLAIRRGQPHRCSGQLAHHVLEIIEATGRSASLGQHIDIASTTERPAPFAGSDVTDPVG